MTTTISIKPVAPTPGIKSIATGGFSSTKVINNISSPIQLFFVDYNGVEHIDGPSIPPNGSFTQNSNSVGDVFRIKDATGNFIADFYKDALSVTVTPSDVKLEYDILAVPETFISANEFVHQTFGYGIINVAKALDVPYSEAPFTGSRISSYDNSASLKYINDYNLWKQGYDGKGVTVAVIGTGIDSNNIEFSGRIIGGYDFGNNDSNPIAGTHPHETGIAGIIAGSATLKVEGSLYDTIGVAPAASILNIKNQKDDGFGATDSTIAKSILYAVDHGAKVISISQGNAGAYKSDELYSAAKYAQDHNVLIAIAAGNNFKDSLGIPAFAWIGLNNFIVVGNWNMDGYNLFSSSNKLGSVDVPYVVAPSSGWQVQLNNSYAYYEDGGTSSATPYVSGLAVLLFQQHPDWTPAQVISRITSTATSPYSLSVSSPQLPIINTLPTGEVTLLGVAQQNQTLVASTNIADGNGLGSITYQWFSNGQIISNANKSFYALTQTDVGKTISVTASYVDGLNKEETVSSTGVMVSNRNDLPTGNVSISGSTEQNKTLTASNDIADLDGMGVISYQWLRNGALIPNQTQINYTLTQTDVGNTISVKASYIDGFGTAESVTSSPTAKVENVNDSPTGNVTITGTVTQNQILTANNTLADADGLGIIKYQWLREGAFITNSTQSTYTLTQADVGRKITVKASYTDALGTTETISSDSTLSIINVNDAPEGIVRITGTTTQNQTLTVSNTLTDVDGLGEISYQWFSNGVSITNATQLTYTLKQDDVGKNISVKANYIDGFGTTESISSDPTSSIINVNDSVIGSVSIAGSAMKGLVLTASNNLTDADGLGIIRYQWLNDDIAIPNAIQSIYKLTQADAGKNICVKASYIDLQNTFESVTSNNILITANKSPTGSVTIKGTSTYGSALSITNTIKDADGIGKLSYTWQNDKTTLSTNATYTLEDSDIGKQVWAIVSYTDKKGNLEELKSNVLDVTISTKASAVNDILTGTDKADKLNGLAGNDSLIGGLGKDILTGGVGADVFKFNSVNDSSALQKQADTITDFKHAQGDKIDLSAIDANSISASYQPFTYIGTIAFGPDGTAQLRLDPKTSILYGSTNADSTPEFSILLSGVKSLVAEDFIF